MYSRRPDHVSFSEVHFCVSKYFGCVGVYEFELTILYFDLFNVKNVVLSSDFFGNML